MSEPEGIIYPPPELRARIDKTSQFVAKNGSVFEEKLKENNRDKPQFSFLLSGDPFNSYYEYKVRELKASLLGDLDSKSTTQQESKSTRQIDENSNSQQADQQNVSFQGRTGNLNTSQSQQQHHNHHHDSEQDLGRSDTTQQHQYQDESSTTYKEDDRPETVNYSEAGGAGGPRVKQKLNDYIQEMTMKIEEPPQLNHLASPAPSLMQKEFDTIRLTSRTTAEYGRSFLIELVSREQNNSQFDILKPQHGQFSYVTNLIMQYALTRNPPLDITEQMRNDSYSRRHVLNRIKMRAEWTKMLEVEKKKREEEEEKERTLYGQIDWHDFVIVETIDYQPDEKGEYPPTTADQVGTRLLIQQRSEEQTVPEDMDVESDQDEDSNDDVPQADDEFTAPLVPDADIVIRKDYDPKAAAAAKVSQPDAYFVSPITNERIPVNAISDHVKYNLSDPRHLEKKDQIIQGRMNEDQVYAAGSQIQDALKSLAERRTDIFGMDDKETDIGRRIGEEEQAKSKDDRLVWDGYKSSLKKKKLN